MHISTTSLAFLAAFGVTASAAALPATENAEPHVIEARAHVIGERKGYFKVTNFGANHETGGSLGVVEFDVAAPESVFPSAPTAHCLCAADSSNYHGLASCGDACSLKNFLFSFDNGDNNKNGNPSLSISFFDNNSTHAEGKHVFPKKQIKTRTYPPGKKGSQYEYKSLSGPNGGNFSVNAQLTSSA